MKYQLKCLDQWCRYIYYFSGHYTIQSDMSANNERQLYQERYVKNSERQLPSPPDVINQWHFNW